MIIGINSHATAARNSFVQAFFDVTDSLSGWMAVIGCDFEPTTHSARLVCAGQTGGCVQTALEEFASRQSGFELIVLAAADVLDDYQLDVLSDWSHTGSTATSHTLMLVDSPLECDVWADQFETTWTITDGTGTASGDWQELSMPSVKAAAEHLLELSRAGR